MQEIRTCNFVSQLAKNLGSFMHNCQSQSLPINFQSFFPFFYSPLSFFPLLFSTYFLFRNKF